ncbi:MULTISPECIES: LutC/YkgG family protein [Caballeronia]|jgi:L-lactate dehydrogenase complex protein LldG|uniref:Membrane protein n=1 Tax=Caballeronia zhejiangensis TaxID=871203 RepID=A0A656QET1_9BURK|nr:MULTISPECIES: lactate utilization protein C [Caballeronia]KDR28590.1 membrane protein [Caballeronia zhejiangensis]MCG7402823.1 lactate utilization protein C [Caballeronia zhejiangensis]MCI1046188.1 lactate utilization protein C [Caballeronia zhejiangensis]MDR5793587.1 lactate utilization protein C [Caballeronia sp. LZ008]
MDTSDARRNILARIRSAQGRRGTATDAERAGADEYVERHPAGPRPPLPQTRDELIARFTLEAERLSTTVAEVESIDDAPAEAVRYLQSLNLPVDVVAWPALAHLRWSEAGIRAAFRKPADEDLVGITGCFCATAETGSLVLLSGAQTPASGALLPQTHIAIVPASRIVAAHEDAFALMRAERGELPRAVNFVSGPSRTGDIEQTIVLGAHGPYRVHVIVVRGA